MIGQGDCEAAVERISDERLRQIASGRVIHASQETQVLARELQRNRAALTASESRVREMLSALNDLVMLASQHPGAAMSASIARAHAAIGKAGGAW
jgi:hypothetical protein